MTEVSDEAALRECIAADIEAIDLDLAWFDVEGARIARREGLERVRANAAYLARHGRDHDRRRVSA